MAEKIVIRGEDSSWKAPKGIPDDGKMAHMASAAVAFGLVGDQEKGDAILEVWNSQVFFYCLTQ